MIGGNTSAVEKLCESQWPSLNNTSGEATTPNVVSSTVFDLLSLVFFLVCKFHLSLSLLLVIVFLKSSTVYLRFLHCLHIFELTNSLICVPNVDNLYLHCILKDPSCLSLKMWI